MKFYDFFPCFFLKEYLTNSYIRKYKKVATLRGHTLAVCRIAKASDIQ